MKSRQTKRRNYIRKRFYKKGTIWREEIYRERTRKRRDYLQKIVYAGALYEESITQVRDCTKKTLYRKKIIQEKDIQKENIQNKDYIGKKLYEVGDYKGKGLHKDVIIQGCNYIGKRRHERKNYMGKRHGEIITEGGDYMVTTQGRNYMTKETTRGVDQKKNINTEGIYTKKGYTQKRDIH